MLEIKHKGLPGSGCYTLPGNDWMWSGHRILQPRQSKWHAEATSGYSKAYDDKKKLLQYHSTSKKMIVKGGCYGRLCQSESETAYRIAVGLHISTQFLVSESVRLPLNRHPHENYGEDPAVRFILHKKRHKNVRSYNTCCGKIQCFKSVSL